MLDTCNEHPNCVVVFTYPQIEKCPFCVDTEQRNIRIDIERDAKLVYWREYSQLKNELQRKSKEGKNLRRVEKRYATKKVKRDKYFES